MINALRAQKKIAGETQSRLSDGGSGSGGPLSEYCILGLSGETLAEGQLRTRERISARRPPPTSIFDGITYNDFVVPFSVSYQADVWGRIRKNVESYREQAQASAGTWPRSI